MKRACLLLGAFLAFNTPYAAAQAQDGPIFKAPLAETVRVNRWGIYRDITGASANPVMVPTGDVTEWSPERMNSFLANGAIGTKVGACMADGVAAAGSYCSTRPGQAIGLGITSTGDTTNPPSYPSAVGSRAGKFVVVTTISPQIRNSLYLTGVAGPAAIAKQEPRRGKSFAVSVSEAAFSPDDRFILRVTNKNTDVFELAPNSNGIYDITYVATNSAARDSKGTDFRFSKMTIDGSLFYSKVNYSGSVFSRKNTAQAITIFKRSGTGYVLDQTIGIDLHARFQVSDDGSEIFVYEPAANRVRIYVRNPDTGHFSFAEILDGSDGNPVPRVMADGGTVAIAYETGSPTRSGRRSYESYNG